MTIVIGASRPPSQGVACRLGSFIIKAASSKKNALRAHYDTTLEAEPHLVKQLLYSGIVKDLGFT
jgi:hypothetical protein